MAQMKNRNAQLKRTIGAMAPKERILEVNSLPKEDTVNRQGLAAYSLEDEVRLVAMLNTLKVQPQFYRSENEIIIELSKLIEKVGLSDPYFLAQIIVYSRCLGEGMRTINHLAAALAAPFLSGQEYAKRFYGMFNKKLKSGGCIFRVDDMQEIKDAYAALNPNPVTNAMKKGFAKTLEQLDTYQLSKYSKTVIDIANLVHPNSKLSSATIKVNGEEMKTLDALMRGITVTADTWESAQSEAGQVVAKAIKEGKLSQEEGEKVLSEAKADNWENLLKEGKLGILAALRNIRNIMKNPRKEMIDLWCELITDADKVRKALILPIHFDLAYETVASEYNRFEYTPAVLQALQKGYEASIPNLASKLTGKTCIFIDWSCSMGSRVKAEGGSEKNYSFRSTSDSSCYVKAGLVAATIAKATGADIVAFGSSATKVEYNKNLNVFALAKQLGQSNLGCTELHTAFDLIRAAGKVYDRIIILSDNEVNGRVSRCGYDTYIHDICSPYVYAIDLAAYGTIPVKNVGKVNYYFGYGPSMYEDIMSKEFNALDHLERIRAIVI